jgi:hypothetical protein
LRYFVGSVTLRLMFSKDFNPKNEDATNQRSSNWKCWH